MIDQCKSGMAMTERNVIKVSDEIKNQTRRIIKMNLSGRGRNRAFCIGSDENRNVKWHPYRPQYIAHDLIQLSPHKLGDILYVKEALKKSIGGARYKSCGDKVMVDGQWRNWSRNDGTPWKQQVIPARYMPKVCARTFLKITDVRCEHIKDISLEDIKAEGCSFEETDDGEGFRNQEHAHGFHKAKFYDLWNETNGKGAWERNDWVYAYTFELAK